MCNTKAIYYHVNEHASNVDRVNTLVSNKPAGRLFNRSGILSAHRGSEDNDKFANRKLQLLNDSGKQGRPHVPVELFTPPLILAISELKGLANS